MVGILQIHFKVIGSFVSFKVITFAYLVCVSIKDEEKADDLQNVTNFPVFFTYVSA